MCDPDMSVSQPAESFPVRGKSGSTMKLPLDREGDHNGNAFPMSSSSSSSSSCLGESSPESLRSLSSLSEGRIDSPLDYDMFEVTVVTTVMSQTDQMADVPKWGPEEEGSPDDNNDVSMGKMQTAAELTESNDNSVSVYLDASSEYHQDTLNDNDNLTLAPPLSTNSGSRVCSGNKRRRGSETPDSEATEIPVDDDDDDDEEEALFLSVSSDMGVCRSSMTLTGSSRRASGSSAVTSELQTEGCVALSGADEDERSELVFDGPQVTCVPGQIEGPASEDLNKTSQASSSSCSQSPTHDVKEVTSPPLEGAESYATGSKPHSRQRVRAAKTKTTPSTSPAHRAGVTAARPSSLEAKRVSRQDPKILKAKVGPRSAPSPPKIPSQVLQLHCDTCM